MPRIFIDGFEGGQKDLWDAESEASVVSTTGLDMDGDYCLDLNYAYEYVQKTITANDEMYFAFLYRPTSDSGSELVISLFNSGTFLLYLERDSGTLKTCRGSGGTVLESGTSNLTISSTYFIEVHIEIADTGGRFEVKVDGVQDIDYTGDTKEGASTQFNQVRLGYSNAAPGTLSTYAFYDNFIMDTAGWIGKTMIQAIVPVSAGNSTNWTPSTGDNYACVDEIPASDVDYVSINAVDTTDTYTAGNMIGTVGNVKCVQVQARSRTEGAPTPINIKLVIRSSATDYLSGDKLVPINEQSLWHLWETNPADSLAWEEADVNAVEFGVRSAA